MIDLNEVAKDVCLAPDLVREPSVIKGINAKNANLKRKRKVEGKEEERRGRGRERKRKGKGEGKLEVKFFEQTSW